MKTISGLEQGTLEWLAHRRTGIGSSDIAAICGVDPWRSALDIYADKMDLSDNEPNVYMQRGSQYEDEARRFFCSLMNRAFFPLNIEHSERSHFKASLDGYCEGLCAVLEIKVPTGRKTLDMAKNGEIPINYQYQMQWQMYVSDCPVAYYFVYDPDTLEHYTIIYREDKLFQTSIIYHAEKFWTDHVLAVVPPPDKKAVKLVDDMEVTEILNEMSKIKTDVKNLEEEYESLKSDLFKLQGTNESISNGYITFTRSETQSYDYRKAAMDAKVDLEPYKKPKTVSWTIRAKERS